MSERVKRPTEVLATDDDRERGGILLLLDGRSSLGESRDAPLAAEMDEQRR
jgi:hypothetical protein